MYKHVFYSWLLALALTLAGLWSYDLAESGFKLYDVDWTLLTGFAIAAVLIASPSLFISLLLFRYIKRTTCGVVEKFLLWCISALAAVVLNIVLLLLFCAPFLIKPSVLLEFWPAYVGTIVSLSLRFRYFILLCVKEEINPENISPINR